MAIPGQTPKLPVAVEKATPYTFDLGILTAFDANPLVLDPSSLETCLAASARDAAQALINQLLTTCPVSHTRDGVALTLPPQTTAVPREKPLPKPREPTKWERFAAKKGIRAKTREQRRNLAFDEESQTWAPKWGKGGLNKKGEDDWCVEVDPKKEAALKEGQSIRREGYRDRKERIKRNERRERKNARISEGKNK
ncbi:hypothetical protein TD95_002681 [Thielaviopsis punctulata]|uniref:Ribosome biogenesis regulatory protein n=1 Tax=Thielaviopsis punctulata TaxID=72032 RepID=A0A0F4ZFX7_9PEZI|nr:hypothetical protein TD95_002681 [Thielaviopsis punctulata]